MSDHYEIFGGPGTGAALGVHRVRGPVRRGDIVDYKVDDTDDARRKYGAAIQRGQIVPMIVISVVDNRVNGQAFLSTEHDAMLCVRLAREGDGEGEWSWPA